MGDYFMAGLRSIRSNIVKEVRGRGLMLAVELHPEAGGARKYCYALKDRGLLAKDTHGHTIRIAPPLVVTQGPDRLGAGAVRRGADQADLSAALPRAQVAYCQTDKYRLISSAWNRKSSAPLPTRPDAPCSSGLPPAR